MIKFPDVIYMGGNHFRLITPEAHRWVISETTADDTKKNMDLRPGKQVLKKMKLDLTVARPVDPFRIEHQRSLRRQAQLSPVLSSPL